MDKKPRSSGGKSGLQFGLAVTGGVFGTIWRMIVTVIMVGIITGCIVACIMTVYILKYIGADNEIDLNQAKLGYTSIIYAFDSETQQYEEYQFLYYGGENRIWVDYDQMNDYTKDALVAIEDKRFWDHGGVDWKRTFGAFVNMFVPIYKTNAGGSTITQQLIKNITLDDDLRIERKVREIFRALKMTEKYSKEQVLEAYLNVVPFGNGTNGIQAAAQLYFDKDAIDLTLAESAAIVGITQFPGRYNPFTNPDNNKERRDWILHEMLDQALITEAQYNEAINEVLDFKGDKHYETLATTQNYFIDHVINEIIDDLMEEKGYTHSEATEQIYRGGYRIYITMDQDIQTHLEEIYSSTDNFPAVWNEEYPQSAAVITDPHGKILALVGGIGEKEGARVLNRATQSKRHPGSSIKPLAAYALAFEYNAVTWSTMLDDSPITLADGSSWPSNYYGGYDGPMTIDVAIQRSTNTIPVKLVELITPRRVFDFLQNDLHFHSLVEYEVVGNQVFDDINLSSMALGGMTHGVTPLEMAGGYQIYVNGGQFTQPYSYTEVLDSNGRVVLQKDTAARQVIGKDTAVVVNKLLQRVVSGPRGTGTAANLGIMPTAGKTGTSTDDVDQWFIGITPYYVGQVWLGYDTQTYTDEYGNRRTNTIRYSGLGYAPPVLWRTIMLPLHENLEYASFVDSENVVSMQYCTITGDLAAEGCPSATGWYKKSKIPHVCTGHPSVEDDLEVDDSDDDWVEGDSSGSSSSGSSSSSSSNSGNSGSSSGSSGEGGSIFDRLNLDDFE